MPPEPSREKSSGRGNALKKVAGFTVLEKLGQGAMGAVFKARQESLDRIVALKVLPPSIAKDKNFTERFLREARAVGKLNHPHIVRGIDVGKDEATGLWYLAMEFVDGPSVGDVLKKEGKLDESRVRKIAREVLEALDYVQTNGIVHRDIKPDNILLDDDSRTKLADLGLAKRVDPDALDSSLTQTGKAVGTPHYMSPEQVRGELEQVDAQSDLYGLGGTLYHMVTGKTPYPGNTGAAIMAAHLTDAVPLAHKTLPEVSEPFSRLLARMMEKEKADRPKSAEEVLRRLDTLEEELQHTGRRRPLHSTTGPRGRITASQRPIRGTTGPVGRITTAHGRITGSRGPIGAPEAEKWPKRKTSNSTPVILAVGGVALVAFLAFMMSGGPSEQAQKGRKKRITASKAKKNASPVPIPHSKPKPQPVVAAPTAEELDREFKAAVEFEDANPDAYGRIVDRYDALLEKVRRAGGAKLRERTTARLDATRKRWSMAADEAWKKMEAEFEEPRKAGDYGKAVTLAGAVPTGFEPVLADRSRDAVTKLREEAEGKINPVLVQARAAMVEKRHEDGLKLLASLASLKYPPLSARIAGLKAELTAAMERAKEERLAAARGEAKKKLNAILDRFDRAVLEKGGIPEGAQIARGAGKEKELEAVAAEVKALGAVAKALEGILASEKAALEKLVGKNVEWPVAGRKIKGKVVRIRGRTIMIRASEKGATMDWPVSLDKIPAQTRDQFLPKPVPAKPEEALAVALLNLKKGAEDIEAARGYLKQAEPCPLTPRYKNLLIALTAGVAEARASAALDDLVQAYAKGKMTEERAKRLMKDVETFNKEHGVTKIAIKRKPELDALILRAEEVLGPTVKPVLETWFLKTGDKPVVDSRKQPLTIHGNYQWVKDDALGVPQHVLELSRGVVIWPYEEAFDLKEATISAWFYYINGDGSIAGKAENRQDEYSLLVWKGRLGTWGGWPRARVNQTNYVVPKREWLFVTHTWNEKENLFWVNGELKGTLKHRVPLRLGKGRFEVGLNSPGGDEYLHMRIAFVGLYPAMFTEKDMSSLMRKQKSKLFSGK